MNLKSIFNSLKTKTATIEAKLNTFSVYDIIVPVYNGSDHDLPSYSTPGASGLDLRANIGKRNKIIILPRQTVMVPTGLRVAVPSGYELQVRPRSGLALKHGITVLNTPGTVDSDYRGEVGVILINHSDKEFTVEDGDRVAQAVFAPIAIAKWTQVKEVCDLTSTLRGEGGFNSTGVK